MSGHPDQEANAAPPRPTLERRRSGSLGLNNVWAVLRRELGARLFTSAYLWSTIAFAALSFGSPLLFSSDTNSDAPVIALTPATEQLAPALMNSARGVFTVEQVESREDGDEHLRDGTADALLVPGNPEEASGWILVGESTVNTDLIITIQNILTVDALSAVALEGGVAPEAISGGATGTTVTAAILNTDGGTQWEIILALLFGAITVFVIVLWGATMASDVVQEKATRVVEIIVATIKPWQLLAGKVIAITVVGLLQIGLVIVAAYAGMQLFSDGIDLSAMTPAVLITGVISVLIGVPLLAMLMAAMAARVEHQDDIGTATQPVYFLLMLPFAATVYVGLDAPDGLIMEILSIAPIANIFAMPVRVAATAVPEWQIALSLAIGLLTLAASVLIAGRIYSNSILRAGTTVSLRQSLARD